jgi:hypothetical protein
MEDEHETIEKCQISRSSVTPHLALLMVYRRFRPKGSFPESGGNTIEINECIDVFNSVQVLA